MGRKLWLRHGVDIHKESKYTGEAQSLMNQYNSVLKYTRILESRLKDSKDMKDGGLTNDVIKMVFEKGITVGAVENEKDKMAAYDFLKGKNISATSKPNEIWELQKLLNANDYNLSISGVYDASTDSALLDFQRLNNIYPSHICDDLTLKKLAE
jgi:phosphoribosylformylglycinamidine (FGAM) synthase-like enzyme